MNDWIAKWVAANSNAYHSKSLPIFRREFSIDRAVRRAIVRICGLGHHELHINNNHVSDDVLAPGWTDYRKTCFFAIHDVTGLLNPGPNGIGVMLGNGMYH